MRLRINGYIKGKANRGEIFEDDGDFMLSIDDCLEKYQQMHPNCDNIRIKVSKLAAGE